MPSTHRTTPRLLLLLPIGAIAVFALNQILRGATHDDAYISLRYLDQWLAGNGLVFNPGERVEGYSNFLWILLLAPLRALGVAHEPLLISGGLLAMAAAAGAAGLVCLRAVAAPQRGNAVLLATSMVAGSASFAYWSRSGMETMAYIGLIGFSAAALIAQRPRTAALLLAAVALTRPEGVMLGVLWLGIWTWTTLRSDTTWRKVAGVIAIFLIPVIAHLLWRHAYYGDWLPNTYYAKLGGPGLAGKLPDGAKYFTHWLIAGGLPLIAAVAFFFLPWRKIRIAGSSCAGLPAWLMLSGCAYFVAFAIGVGGDFMPFSRFLAPTEFLAIVLLASLYAARPLIGGGFAASFIAVSALSAIHLSPLNTDSEKQLREDQRPTLAFLHQILAVQDLGRPPLVALNAAGWIPATQPDWKFIDMLGLNDRTIAYEGQADQKPGRRFAGHNRALGSYVCARAPDIVLTAGGDAVHARTAKEAEAISFGSFVSDRDFVRACGTRYTPISQQVAPGKYSVVWVPNGTPASHRFRTADGGEMHPKALNEKGILLLQTGRSPEAEAAFQAAATAAPGMPGYWANLGFSLLDQDKVRDALTAFDSGLAADRQHPESRYGRAIALAKLGRESEAIADLQTFVDLPAAKAPELRRFRERANALLGRPSAP